MIGCLLKFEFNILCNNFAKFGNPYLSTIWFSVLALYRIGCISNGFIVKDKNLIFSVKQWIGGMVKLFLCVEQKG